MNKTTNKKPTLQQDLFTSETFRLKQIKGNIQGCNQVLEKQERLLELLEYFGNFLKFLKFWNTFRIFWIYTNFRIYLQSNSHEDNVKTSFCEVIYYFLEKNVKAYQLKNNFLINKFRTYNNEIIKKF